MRVLKLIIKKYFWPIMALITGGVVMTGATMAHTLYTRSRYPTPLSMNQDKSDTLSEQRPQLDRYSVIFQRTLFAPALSETADAEEAKKDITTQTAAMVFKLKGTVVVDKGVSYAIIEDPATREQELIHQNDVVKGFTIERIVRNKVVVKRDGREETIEVLEEARPAEEPTAVAGPGSRPRPPIIKRRPLQVPQKQPSSPQGTPAETM